MMMIHRCKTHCCLAVIIVLLLGITVVINNNNKNLFVGVLVVSGLSLSSSSSSSTSTSSSSFSSRKNNKISVVQQQEQLENQNNSHQQEQEQFEIAVRNDRLERSKNRILQGFVSPSKKLTLSTEIVINSNNNHNVDVDDDDEADDDDDDDDIYDPTTFLLRSNSIRKLSNTLRTCRTDSIFIQCTSSCCSSSSLNLLSTFIDEQKQMEHDNPIRKPVPVIYCCCGRRRTNKNNKNNPPNRKLDNMDAVANTGVDGIMIPMNILCNENNNDEYQDENNNNNNNNKDWFLDMCRTAMNAGIQPIPEIIIDTSATAASTWTEQKVTDMVDEVSTSIEDTIGFKPISMVLSTTTTKEVAVAEHGQQQQNQDDDEEAKENAVTDTTSTTTTTTTTPTSSMSVPLPISKELRNRIPILGSVRVIAGDNRLSIATKSYKESGYTGAVLRHECIPEGLRNEVLSGGGGGRTFGAGQQQQRHHQQQQQNKLFRNLDPIDVLTKFWSACIIDLKSTKSKSFHVTTRNNMEKSLSTQWTNYQNNVIESGALGDPNDNYSIVNEEAGEYKGFA